MIGSVFRNTVKYTRQFIAKIMICARDTLIDLFALTRFLIPVAFTDIAVDVGEQVNIITRPHIKEKSGLGARLLTALQSVLRKTSQTSVKYPDYIILQILLAHDL